MRALYSTILSMLTFPRIARIRFLNGNWINRWLMLHVWGTILINLISTMRNVCTLLQFKSCDFLSISRSTHIDLFLNFGTKTLAEIPPFYGVFNDIHGCRFVRSSEPDCRRGNNRRLPPRSPRRYNWFSQEEAASRQKWWN